MRQNCAIFKFFFVGLVCLTYSFGGFADQTPDLAKKLLGAVANNDLGAVQQIVGEGADPRSNNENGLSAIDIAVDRGFFDIAHFLLAAKKQNTRSLSKPFKLSAEKQSSEQPDGSSVIDTISNFFKTNVFDASIVKAEPTPVLLEKKAIISTPKIKSNPFTKLTDAILDFLPDSPQDEVQPIQNVKPTRPIDSITGPDKKVIYPVADLTEAENPYKIEKVVQIKELPRALESVKSITEPVVNVQPVAVAPLPNVKPRNLTQNDLMFGGRGRLDAVFEKMGNEADSCVIKASWKSAFCIESFNWPSEIQNEFGTFGGVSGNRQSIVHYLNGKSVQYHGRFPNQSFNPIANYIMSKLGAPTEAPKIITAMLGAAKQPNQVYRWITATTDDQPPVILEMREIDDLRWSLPPDRFNGLIRMYRKGEASIFKILTAADLLLLQIRKGGQQKALSSKDP